MKKILYIDDNVKMLAITLEALKLEGFNALGANSGEKGIEIAKKEKPDLIICDIMMPQINGYQVRSYLNADPATALIPFIFFTALADKEDILKGIEYGTDGYLIKPVPLDKLLKAIHKSLKKSEEIENYAQEQLNKLLKKILHTLPHEFLTPLHGILGFSKLINEHYKSFSSKEIKEMANAIEKNGKRLQNLIDNFLYYIKLTSRHVPDLRYIKIENFAEALKEISTSIAKKYSRTDDLIFEIENAELIMEYDDFNFIVKELTDNAFKFSTANSKVIVTSKIDNDIVEIRIKDHGIGFPLENTSDISAFNQFNRRKQEQQGVGFGLISSMLITQKYNGSLQFNNEIPGTTVILKLPIDCQINLDPDKVSGLALNS